MCYEKKLQTKNKDTETEDKWVTPLCSNRNYLSFMCNTHLFSGTIKICGSSQVNKSNQCHNPIYDAEIVGNDSSVSELALLVVTMAGSGLKSVKKMGKGYIE
jgi:hypothetical protein